MFLNLKDPVVFFIKTPVIHAVRVPVEEGYEQLEILPFCRKTGDKIIPVF
jgi:hypothetical protein